MDSSQARALVRALPVEHRPRAWKVYKWMQEWDPGHEPWAIIGPNVDDTYHLPGTKSLISILHTTIACTCCGEDFWIGPEQRKVADAGQGMPTCYLCAAAIRYFANDGDETTADFGGPVVSVGAGTDDLPRMFDAGVRIPGTPYQGIDVSNARFIVKLSRTSEPQPPDKVGRALCVLCREWTWMTRDVDAAIASGDAIPVCLVCYTERGDEIVTPQA